jgi:hypothetical protein
LVEKSSDLMGPNIAHLPGIVNISFLPKNVMHEY